MNEQELQTYALRGLAARLNELDDERARILVLLEQWGGNANRKVTRRPPGTPRPDLIPDAEPSLVADHAAPPVMSPTAEREVARVLPRRRLRVSSDRIAVEPVPALPPMPRLVKARAS